MKHFIAVFLVLAMTANALAGGGGKANKKIITKNLGAEILAVIVDPPGGLGYAIPPDQATFENDGGKILNTGETATFKVQKGSHILAGAYINAAGVVGAPDAIPNLNVGNQTVRVEVTGNFAAGPTFTIVSSF